MGYTEEALGIDGRLPEALELFTFCVRRSCEAGMGLHAMQCGTPTANRARNVGRMMKKGDPAWGGGAGGAGSPFFSSASSPSTHYPKGSHKGKGEKHANSTPTHAALSGERAAVSSSSLRHRVLSRARQRYGSTTTPSASREHRNDRPPSSPTTKAVPPSSSFLGLSGEKKSVAWRGWGVEEEVQRLAWRERALGLRLLHLLLDRLPCANGEAEHACASWLFLVLTACKSELFSCLATNIFFSDPFSLFQSSVDVIGTLLCTCHFPIGRELHTLLAVFVLPLLMPSSAISSPIPSSPTATLTTTTTTATPACVARRYFRHKFAVLSMIHRVFQQRNVVISWFINGDCNPSFDPTGSYRGMLELLVGFVMEMIFTDQCGRTARRIAAKRRMEERREKKKKKKKEEKKKREEAEAKRREEDDGAGEKSLAASSSSSSSSRSSGSRTSRSREDEEAEWHVAADPRHPTTLVPFPLVPSVAVVEGSRGTSMPLSADPFSESSPLLSFASFKPHLAPDAPTRPHRRHTHGDPWRETRVGFPHTPQTPRPHKKAGKHPHHPNHKKKEEEEEGEGCGVASSLASPPPLPQGGEAEVEEEEAEEEEEEEEEDDLTWEQEQLLRRECVFTFQSLIASLYTWVMEDPKASAAAVLKGDPPMSEPRRGQTTSSLHRPTPPTRRCRRRSREKTATVDEEGGVEHTVATLPPVLLEGAPTGTGTGGASLPSLSLSSSFAGVATTPPPPPSHTLRIDFDGAADAASPSPSSYYAYRLGTAALTPLRSSLWMLQQLDLSSCGSSVSSFSSSFSGAGLGPSSPLVSPRHDRLLRPSPVTPQRERPTPAFTATEVQKAEHAVEGEVCGEEDPHGDATACLPTASTAMDTPEVDGRAGPASESFGKVSPLASRRGVAQPHTGTHRHRHGKRPDALNRGGWPWLPSLVHFASWWETQCDACGRQRRRWPTPTRGDDRTRVNNGVEEEMGGNEQAVFRFWCGGGKEEEAENRVGPQSPPASPLLRVPKAFSSPPFSFFCSSSSFSDGEEAARLPSSVPVSSRLVRYHWKHIHHLRQNKLLAIHASRMIADGKWKEAKVFLEAHDYHLPCSSATASAPFSVYAEEARQGLPVPPDAASYAPFARFLLAYPNIRREAVEGILEKVNKTNDMGPHYIAREYFHAMHFAGLPIDLAFRDAICHFISWERPMFEADTWATLQTMFGESYARQNPDTLSATDAGTMGGVLLFLHSMLHNENVGEKSRLEMGTFVRSAMDCLESPHSMTENEVQAVYHRVAKEKWRFDAYGRTPREVTLEAERRACRLSQPVWQRREGRLQEAVTRCETWQWLEKAWWEHLTSTTEKERARRRRRRRRKGKMHKEEKRRKKKEEKRETKMEEKERERPSPSLCGDSPLPSPHHPPPLHPHRSPLSRDSTSITTPQKRRENDAECERGERDVRARSHRSHPPRDGTSSSSSSSLSCSWSRSSAWPSRRFLRAAKACHKWYYTLALHHLRNLLAEARRHTSESLWHSHDDEEDHDDGEEEAEAEERKKKSGGGGGRGAEKRLTAVASRSATAAAAARHSIAHPPPTTPTALRAPARRTPRHTAVSLPPPPPLPSTASFSSHPPTSPVVAVSPLCARESIRHAASPRAASLSSAAVGEGPPLQRFPSRDLPEVDPIAILEPRMPFYCTALMRWWTTVMEAEAAASQEATTSTTTDIVPSSSLSAPPKSTGVLRYIRGSGKKSAAAHSSATTMDAAFAATATLPSRQRQRPPPASSSSPPRRRPPQGKGRGERKRMPSWSSPKDSFFFRTTYTTGASSASLAQWRHNALAALQKLETIHRLFFFSRFDDITQPFLLPHYAEHIRPMLQLLLPSVLAGLYFMLCQAEEMPLHDVIAGIQEQIAVLSSVFLLEVDGLERAVMETLKWYAPELHARGMPPPHGGGFVLYRLTL